MPVVSLFSNEVHTEIGIDPDAVVVVRTLCFHVNLGKMSEIREQLSVLSR